MDPLTEVYVITRGAVNPKGITIFAPAAGQAGVPVGLAATFEDAVNDIHRRFTQDRDAGNDRPDYAFHGPFPLPDGDA